MSEEHNLLECAVQEDCEDGFLCTGGFCTEDPAAGIICTQDNPFCSVFSGAIDQIQDTMNANDPEYQEEEAHQENVETAFLAARADLGAISEDRLINFQEASAERAAEHIENAVTTLLEQGINTSDAQLQMLNINTIATGTQMNADSVERRTQAAGSQGRGAGAGRNVSKKKSDASNRSFWWLSLRKQMFLFRREGLVLPCLLVLVLRKRHVLLDYLQWLKGLSLLRPGARLP